jgi:hypothetical protein
MVTRKISGCAAFFGGDGAALKAAVRLQISSARRTFTATQTSIITDVIRTGFGFTLGV